ncbi:MAG: hypothetical protein ACTSQ8_17480 [Candidatus Helarchaeota archaeon]
MESVKFGEVSLVVRAGMEPAESSIGDDLMIMIGGVSLIATVVAVICIPFDCIKNGMLKDECNEACRSISGLHSVLLKENPSFKTSDIVTLIYFIPIKVLDENE